MNYVISITKPEAMPHLEQLCGELSVPICVSMHGRGTATGSMRELLGIESSERQVMLSVASREKTRVLIEEQRRRLHLGVPGHGIVIAVPIKSVGGGKTMAMLRGNEPMERAAAELLARADSDNCGQGADRSRYERSPRGGSTRRYRAARKGHRQRCGEIS